MKYCTLISSLLGIAGVFSAPLYPTAPYANSTGHLIGKTQYQGFILPSIVKNHDINSNLNTRSSQAVTSRTVNSETSSLFEIPIPANLTGKSCHLVISADVASNGDAVSGSQAMDIFSTNIVDLVSMRQGNLRNIQQARMRFNTTSGLYTFDETILAPRLKDFPCPAGTQLELESVAVGDYDINNIRQDFIYNGQKAPNGLSIGYN
ncbi:uncharacterized protein JN550_003650 [Neoarthrinium moseri]|uniref:uncharacterized protein n=1 Tax=Neoarthrinium moseri TaxID=1658444 RepID=UPI001FDC90BA|nr:uncharacterized protein JN550_003650 [Neoarthrinium moseri]KAI1872776.1 hypothetical protein JN550_003650 [Neoarthrinium moseri]